MGRLTVDIASLFWTTLGRPGWIGDDHGSWLSPAVIEWKSSEVIMRRIMYALMITVILSGCASTPPEMQVINDAAEALGGAPRIQQIRTLVIEGAGTAPNLGQ